MAGCEAVLACGCHQAAGEEPSQPELFPGAQSWLVMENAEVKIVKWALQAETLL